MCATNKEVSYVISVSVGPGCYRHLKISSKATLFQLHEAILDAFEFIDDHAHAFFMDNRAWSDVSSYYSDMIEDENRYTNDYELERVGIFIGEKFKYIFDFGDEWTFQCKVLKVIDEITEEPVVVRSKGEAPQQYGDEDWEYEDEETEDDE